MDYSKSGGWVELLTGVVMMMLSVSLVTTSTAPTVHHAVVCLVSDGPDILQDELYLHCKQAGVINVLSARHGYREQAVDTKTCGPTTGPDGPCSSDHPVFMGEVLRRCMGVSKCYVPVVQVYLDDCKANSNYVQVEYECVPDNSIEPDNIVDVCGEMMQGTQVSRLSGYIKTPDYPDLYPPDISCSCNLTALDSQAQITLTLLDIQLEDPRDTSCKWDWLEYTTAVHGWGRGVRVCQRPHHSGYNSTFTGNKTILLNFRADNKVEDRGFWLKYEGRNMVGDEVEVLLQCKNFQPNILHREAACIGDSGTSELFLDCNQDGVINILSAQHGLQPAGGATGGSIDQCHYQGAPQCVTSAVEDPELLRRCMGQGACTIPVTPQPLPPCAGGVSSDYLQVKYQCIPAAYEPTNIVDVCGDILNGAAAFRHSGYIQSPNYPQRYPPSLRCQCLLSTDSDADIRLSLLDINLAGDTVTAACDADWLRYTLSHAAGWGSGEGLCHKGRDRVINTGSSEIRLDFNSDDSVEERGFWVHYNALRSDGLHVGVQVMCREADKQQFVDTSPVGATPLKPSTVNTGLVAGLSSISILIVIFLLVLAVLKYRRVRKGKMAESSSVASSVISQEKIPTTSNTYNKYSNFGESPHQNYHTLHNPSPLPPTLQCDPQREYVEQHPDYDVTAGRHDLSKLGGGNTPPPSYVNPAFDGSLEPSANHNVAC